jgi:hypothetical protein
MFNPAINKCRWRAEDDRQLLQFVALYGEGGWMGIAAGFENRYDV